MESRKSSNTLEKAKKGAAYGGFFGSSLGLIAGLIEFHHRGYWWSGLNPKGVYTGIGLVVGISAGTIIGTSLGLFGTKNKQLIGQSNKITDSAAASINETSHRNKFY